MSLHAAPAKKESRKVSQCATRQRSTLLQAFAAAVYPMLHGCKPALHPKSASQRHTPQR